MNNRDCKDCEFAFHSKKWPFIVCGHEKTLFKKATQNRMLNEPCGPSGEFFHALPYLKTKETEDGRDISRV